MKATCCQEGENPERQMAAHRNYDEIPVKAAAKTPDDSQPATH